ncbi:MAG: glutamyl-tRNA reductase [Candidatus Latescibacteria bacterium]|nr:glutamyl-tRNA reductase [Candidatus Latescibacterota bacterium]
MEPVKAEDFFLAGISYKTASVEIREKLSFDGPRSAEVMKGIYDLKGVRECVLVSTCNRTELYAVVSGDPDEVRETVEHSLLDLSGTSEGIVESLYYRHGEEVIRHLFRVVSGLDSMILGEPQIFGQVKNAYSNACDCKCTGSALNRLFHNAFRVGKRIRHLTAVGVGAVSVSFAAVELAKKIIGDLSASTVLLIGAGKIGELSARHLVESGIGTLHIANRTASRAAELAARLNGHPVDFSGVFPLFGKTDIVISSVAAKKPVITRENIERFVADRQNALLLIDLGVPRNAADDIAGLGTVTLRDIDDLESLTLDNMDRRRGEAEKAEKLISVEVAQYLDWLSEREAAPVIRELHVKCENIRIEEIGKLRNRVDTETFEKIDLVTRRIVRKILHNPVIAMRSTESNAKREQLLKSVHELFIRECDQ